MNKYSLMKAMQPKSTFQTSDLDHLSTPCTIQFCPSSTLDLVLLISCSSQGFERVFAGAVNSALSQACPIDFLPPLLCIPFASCPRGLGGMTVGIHPSLIFEHPRSAEHLTPIGLPLTTEN
jgi:hypothetical protein